MGRGRHDHFTETEVAHIRKCFENRVPTRHAMAQLNCSDRTVQLYYRRFAEEAAAAQRKAPLQASPPPPTITPGQNLNGKEVTLAKAFNPKDWE